MKYTILKNEAIFKNRFLTIEKVGLKIDAFRGKPLEIERYGLVRPNVVGVLVYIPETEKLVLVEQFRYATISTGSGWLVEIVAGVIEAGATPEETARREVMEEVGYEVKTLRKIAEYYTSPGFSNQYTYFYLAETAPNLKLTAGGGLEAEGEDIRIHEVDLPEAREMLRSGQFHDAMTMVALQHFFLVYHKH